MNKYEVSAVYCYSIYPPLPMVFLCGGVSSCNPSLLCGSRWDKTRAGYDNVITGDWLVLLGGRGSCYDVPVSVVCNAGALLSSFPCSSCGPLKGLRIGGRFTEASSFLRNLQFIPQAPLILFVVPCYFWLLHVSALYCYSIILSTLQII